MNTLSILAGLFFLLAALAAFLDSYLSDQKVDEVRLAILAWWKGFQQQRPTHLAQQASLEFVRLFDAMYGERHFSWKTIWRSLVFSTFGFFVVVLICELIEPGYIPDVIDRGLFYSLFIGNLIADYFSLLETRFVLKRCANSRSVLLPVWLVLDVLASYLIYIFIGLGFVALLFGLLAGEGFEWFYRLFQLDFHINVLSHFTDIQNATAFVYSTFFTSFIFYLFIISSFLIRLLQPIQFMLLPAMRWVSISRNLIKSFVGIAGGMAFSLEAMKRLFPDIGR
uniref:Uncharacterized protein n=1 Tax=Candidatus Kentrum sp. FW TaxID=2126338 RepID=A0A450SAQ0_9GAMM|nr:MAG: hypothetical protein BECKFW1821A_GA0114235_102210 [Candidatus Kentron sp. FW]